MQQPIQITHAPSSTHSSMSSTDHSMSTSCVWDGFDEALRSVGMERGQAIDERLKRVRAKEGSEGDTRTVEALPTISTISPLTKQRNKQTSKENAPRRRGPSSRACGAGPPRRTLRCVGRVGIDRPVSGKHSHPTHPLFPVFSLTGLDLLVLVELLIPLLLVLLLELALFDACELL